MDPWANRPSDPAKDANSTYRPGLLEAFPACHEPFPLRFEEMARNLDEAFEKAHNFRGKGVLNDLLRD
jgi:hypothetical protein